MKSFRELAELGCRTAKVAAALEDLETQEIVPRIWAKDHTVWSEEPTQIVDRLGWLEIVGQVRPDLARFQTLRRSLLDEGYTDVLHMGMGGSSLAPDVLNRIFAGEASELRLHVLDSTDPGSVLRYAESLDPVRTFYVVATKSGTTVETLSFFKYFYNRALEILGAEEVGRHFAAITDAGSPLDVRARELGFRERFLNEPHIGGRYSALSYFGLVPAILAGVDGERLLDRAEAMVTACGPEVPVDENPGAWLGAVMGTLANEGVDKLTLISGPVLAPFGDWIEQLIAESTGKSGRGILPVVEEPLLPAEEYQQDRLFVQLRLPEDVAYDAHLQGLMAAGFPVVRLPLQDCYDVGALFFLWEFATAVAGERMHIHPFNQPNVEAAKRRAKEMVATYREQGALPAAEYAPLEARALTEFLAQIRPPAEGRSGDYVALLAYVQPTPETDALLQTLRNRLLRRYGVATTVGYGPRYLHSTGQLHKGDGGQGLFVQFVSGAEEDTPIPDEAGDPQAALSFDVLKQAQAQGDYQALLDGSRRIFRFHLGTDVTGALETLLREV